VGIDLTRSQFLELWVNDFNDHHNVSVEVPRIRGRHVKLHIDLGRVSEDQMRAPDIRPNNRLDTEDRIYDNQLDVTSGRNEDTGLDSLLSDQEAAALPAPPAEANGEYRDLSTSSANDPSGDDFATPDDNYKDEIDARRYLGSTDRRETRTSFRIPRRRT
jgi:hypothetical protein